MLYILDLRSILTENIVLKVHFRKKNYCFDNIMFVTKINSEEILSSYTNLFVMIIICHCNKYILEMQEKNVSVLQNITSEPAVTGLCCCTKAVR